jgi:hypothetical protein
MKSFFQTSGLTKGLEVLIDVEWTPDQASAVIELLDDIRDRIWEHYQLPIIALRRELYGIIEDGDGNTAELGGENEPPF